ncbi:hypothetical protein DEJ13_02445 [Curtobacterium sp. MCLR17_007]|uniref:hypothetical protein n=1 Tax=Curtobacterium sp. MCLR17_007 TaxID=2175648 RepID=UPI0011B444B6|nr:hypothetical protein [Curtobacterium sp. MCLR17_007]WIB60707.1 hypothetical protein DEJ13_02445 [Curtobacterium sp. MCLR17_007]
MRRTRTTRVLGPVLALPVVLLLTACTTEVPDDDSTGRPHGRGQTLSECLRAKGYDTPEPDARSRTQTLDPPAGVDAEQWKQDFQACAEGDAGAGESGVAPAASLTPAQMQRLARCMREHGFEDFPDEPNTGYTPDDPEAYRQVSEQCTATLEGDEG